MRTIFDLHRLIAWLEMQPGDKEYCFEDTGNCLLGQYFKSIGEMDSEGFIGGTFIKLRSGTFDLPISWRHIARGRHVLTRGYNYTFGAALKRARKESECACGSESAWSHASANRSTGGANQSANHKA